MKKLNKIKIKERTFLNNQRIGELKLLIKNLETKISNIENNENISEYCVMFNLVLDKYYNTDDNINNTFLDDGNDDFEDDVEDIKISNTSKNMTMDLFVKRTSDYNDKADMLDHYMSLTDKSYTPEYKKIKIPKCMNCNIECTRYTY